MLRGDFHDAFFFQLLSSFPKLIKKIKTNINHYLCSRCLISFIFSTVPVFRPIVFFRSYEPHMSVQNMRLSIVCNLEQQHLIKLLMFCTQNQ